MSFASSSPRRAKHGQGVGLGPAAAEDDPLRPAAQVPGHDLTRLTQDLLGGQPHPVTG